jgi:dihydroorotase
MSRPVLIKGGWLIDPAHRINGRRDLLVRDGKVAEVSERALSATSAQVIEAAGLWVLPGLIDLHVHLREPGQESKETIQSGSRAAVAGGFTAIVAMPNTQPVNDNALVTHFVRRRAEQAGLCRIFPAGTITKGLRGEELAEIGDLVAAGCVCLTDDGRPVMNAGLMRHALQYAREFGLPVMGHEEDLSLAGDGNMSEGPTATRLGLMPIPRSAEAAMVARDLVLAEETGGRLHLAHLSCEQSVELVRVAKKRGVAVTAEVTPHHLMLTEEAVLGYDTHAKMNPPLRQERDLAALRNALADGTVDAIASDHAPHTTLEKQLEFDKAANGVIGLETSVAVALELVWKGALTPPRFVELLSAGPARAFGLPGGHLGAGAPADVTIVDPEARWTIDAGSFFSLSRNTPFQGRSVKGRVTHTLVQGRVVFERGKIREDGE